MGYNELDLQSPWGKYSRRLVDSIENPKFAGSLSADEVRGLLLVVAKAGAVGDDVVVVLYWLVDTASGVIVDARFQVFGPAVLIGAAESACQAVIDKNYYQAGRINSYLLDKQMRDNDFQLAFPGDEDRYLDIVIKAIQHGTEQCEGITVKEPRPLMPEGSVAGDNKGCPGWMDMSITKKLAVIEEVLDADVRPYIHMDGGGVEIVDLVGNKELIIAYQGACVNCFSAVGSTLAYIQQILSAKVHPDIVVVPNFGQDGFPLNDVGY